MSGLIVKGLGLAAVLLAAATASAQLSPQMTETIPGASYVPRLTPAERADAVRRLMNLASTPRLGEPVALTPNAPQARNGWRLSFWKPSFVIGTAQDGEAGVNFWGLHNQGHVDVGFEAAPAKTYVLDCRLLSGGGSVAYKVYSGRQGTLTASAEAALSGGRLLLAVPSPPEGGPVSVELWPSSDTEPLGFLGCDVSRLG